MGRLSMDGIDSTVASFEALANISEDDAWEIINAGAEVVADYHKRQISEMFKMHSFQLLSSIKIRKKKGDGYVYALVGPDGKRSGPTSAGKRRKNGKGSYSGTNAEVGYFLEYGTPKIRARHWMEAANAKAEDPMIQAETDAWNRRLARLGL